MSNQPHKDKVKLTVECTLDERTYIKRLAAKNHLTISDYILSFVRPEMPKEPNRETKKAMNDIRSKKNVKRSKDLEDFWASLGIDPNT